jgi:hypothetical protein
MLFSFVGLNSLPRIPHLHPGFADGKEGKKGTTIRIPNDRKEKFSPLHVCTVKENTFSVQ